MLLPEIKGGLTEHLRQDRSGRYIMICGVGSFMLIIVIKGILRLLSLRLSDAGNFLMGTLPNFFAATGICAYIFLYTELFVRNKVKFGVPIKCLNFSASVTLGILILWESIQRLLGDPMGFLRYT